MQLLNRSGRIGQSTVGALISRVQLLGGFVQVSLGSGQLGLQLVLDGSQVVVDGLNWNLLIFPFFRSKPVIPAGR